MYNTKKEIKNWLKEMGIKNYVINKDLTVDVNGNVLISFKGLNNFAIKFGIINGSFDCNFNNLTNLKGCPEVINGFFSCCNNKLTSLEYFPKEINGELIYIDENKIKEEELANFNCDITNVIEIYSDFNKNGNKEEFLRKVNYYIIKKENDLLKELSVTSNNMKLNKKL